MLWVQSAVGSAILSSSAIGRVGGRGSVSHLLLDIGGTVLAADCVLDAQVGTAAVRPVGLPRELHHRGKRTVVNLRLPFLVFPLPVLVLSLPFLVLPLPFLDLPLPFLVFPSPLQCLNTAHCPQQPAEAIPLLKKLVGLRERRGDSTAEAAARQRLGEALAMCGQPEAAIGQLEAAHQLHAKRGVAAPGVRLAMADTLQTMGQCYARLGRHEDGTRAMVSCLRLRCASPAAAAAAAAAACSPTTSAARRHACRRPAPDLP